MFPWQNGEHVPVTFVCEHCKEEQPQMRGQVILCTCEGAQKARAAAREQAQTASAPVDMVKLRQQRKI